MWPEPGHPRPLPRTGLSFEPLSRFPLSPLPSSSLAGPGRAVPGCVGRQARLTWQLGHCLAPAPPGDGGNRLPLGRTARLLLAPLLSVKCIHSACLGPRPCFSQGSAVPSTPEQEGSSLLSQLCPSGLPSLLSEGIPKGPWKLGKPRGLSGSPLPLHFPTSSPSCPCSRRAPRARHDLGPPGPLVLPPPSRLIFRSLFSGESDSLPCASTLFPQFPFSLLLFCFVGRREASGGHPSSVGARGRCWIMCLFFNSTSSLPPNPLSVLPPPYLGLQPSALN